MIIRLLACAMLLALNAAPAVGHAAASGKASVTSFSYQLNDLDPNDGITPSIVLNGGVSRVQSEGFPPGAFVEAPSFFGDTAFDFGLKGAKTTSNGPSVFIVNAQDPVRVSALTSGDFTVTPHTQLTVTALGHVEITDAHVFPNSRVFVDASLNLYEPSSGDSFFDDAEIFSVGTLNKPLTFTFSNDTPGVRQVTIILGTVGEFDQPIPSVPEPSEALSFALGLAALVGFSARRR